MIKKFAIVALIATTGILAGRSTEAQNVYAKFADEWGTVQATGPRGASGGNRFWNIQGSDSGEFASIGTLRFNTEGLVSQLNADFPTGWQIDNVTMVIEMSVAGFSNLGQVNAYHVTNDDVAFTNGEDSDGAPGDFMGLGVTPLLYDASVTSGGGTLGIQTAGDIGTPTLINTYTFDPLGGSGALDVLGITGDIVDPALSATVGPDYGITDIATATGDTLMLLDEGIGFTGGNWLAGGLDLLADDIESRDGALSFIFAAEETSTSATYKGNVFNELYPPRLYIEASSNPTAGVIGDYNNDGEVNLGDYTLWRNNLGTTTTLPNDPIGGTIGEGQYTQWRANVGAEANLGAISSQVPEPSSLLVAALGIVAACCVRKLS